MKKRLIKLALAALFLMFISGCGSVKGSKYLTKKAEEAHGKCSVVSKVEEKDRTVVVLKDELQGFEYKVGSGMYDINIDGSYFGSVADEYDSFNEELRNYTMTQVQPDLDSICNKYFITYEPVIDIVFIRLIYPSSLSDDLAIKATEEIAQVFQKYNVNNRLDGYKIYLEHDHEWFTSVYGKYNPGHNDYPDETYSAVGMSEACHVGSVSLPDCKFHKGEY